MNKLFGIFFLLFISCNNDNTAPVTEKNDPGTATEQKPGIQTSCFVKITGRDTAMLMLEQNADNLSGKMLFDNYEKDGSRGTISGKIEGDILRLFYAFDSEGMHSVMEIYFKRENGTLLRGIGDVEVRNDTTYYKDPAAISYTEKEIFDRSDCALREIKL